MQEENDQQTVNSHILITTVDKFLMPKFPEFRDHKKNLTNFLKWMERVERIENMPHAFPHVSEHWILLEKKVMIFTEPGGFFRNVSSSWQLFSYGSLISCCSCKRRQLFNMPQGGSLMQWRAQALALERPLFHSRQRNEIVCITEHFAEATAPSWLVCNGFWRVIRYGPGLKAGIKCCPLPLAAHGVYEE